jgi:glucose/mannose-6-phosphate isomerase
VNPGKQLALDIVGTTPLVWGTSAVAGVAAHRFALRLAADAACPALWGELPGVADEQESLLTADRALRLVVLRDQPGDEVDGRDVPVSELKASDGHPLERLAELVGMGDYAAAYLGLAGTA